MLRPVALAAACTVVAFALPAGAEPFRIVPELTATVTATNNGALTGDAQAQHDLIVDIAPRLSFHSRGGGYTLDGDVALDALVYTQKSAPDRVLPSGRVALKSSLVDRWLYLDVDGTAEQTAANPFGVLTDVPSSVNRVTTLRYGLAPYLSHEFTPTLSLLARAEQHWTRRRADDDTTLLLRDARESNNTVRLTERAHPLGYSFEYSGQRTTYLGDTQTALSTEAVRAVATLAPQPHIVLGAVGGRERNEFSLTRRTDPVYGLRFELVPGERSSLTAAAEHRFFGTGWDVQLKHRSPFLALALRAVRQPVALASSQLLGTASSTAGLLDAMLTTRHPDPVARGALVSDLIARLGLPQQLRGPVEVFSDAPQLEQGLDLSAALRGRLTTLTLSAFQRRYSRLMRADDPLAPLLPDDQANRQQGVALNLNRRLDPLTALNFGLSTNRLRGQGAREGDVTEQRLATVSVSRQLAPATTVTLGARRRLSDTTVAGAADVHESAAYATLSHRF
jgi:uncharacterized protein (PEP-CTERM system associated)